MTTLNGVNLAVKFLLIWSDLNCMLNFSTIVSWQNDTEMPLVQGKKPRIP